MRGLDYLARDFYAQLGVLPSIEQAALTAAYRALLKIYHPDVYKGPRARGERITRELNEAYAVLGNPGRRAAYDHARAAAATRTDRRAPLDLRARRQWAHIAALHPDIEQRRRELEALAPALALDFQRALVERRSVLHAEPLAEAMKRRFLERHFGSSPVVQHFALGAIRARRRDVAHQVNRAIHHHGSPRPAQEGRFVRQMRRATLWFGPFEAPAATGSQRTPMFLHFGLLVFLAGVVFWRVIGAP